MIFLTTTSDVLRVNLTQSISTDITTGWVIHANTGSTPDSFQTNIAVAGVTTIVTAPIASQEHQVKFISIKNRHGATTQLVTLEKFDGTAYELIAGVPLLPDETLLYIDSIGFKVLDENGVEKSTSTGGGSGTVTSVAATTPAEGLSVAGSPITTSGSLDFTLTNDLAAVEGLASTGIAVRSAIDTWVTRSITGTTNEIVVANGSGTAANPTVGLADNPVVPGTGSLMIPTGTTAQRPGAPLNGMIRYNITTGAFESFENGVWVNLVSSAHPVTISTIGGQDIVTYLDSTRSKTLSVETSTYTWAEAALGNNDWIQIGTASHAQSGYIMPHNGTIIRFQAHCEEDNGIAKGINLYINGGLNSTIGSFAGVGNNSEISDNTIDVNVAAGDRIRLRSENAGGVIQDTVATLGIKWRV